MREAGPLCTAVGKRRSPAKGRTEAPQESHTELPCDPAVPLEGTCPQSECRQILNHLSHQGRSSPLPWGVPRRSGVSGSGRCLYTAFSSLVTTARAGAAQASTGQWMEDKVWSPRTREYYPAFKRPRIRVSATTRMNRNNTVLHGINQSQKDKSYVILLLRGRVRFTEMESGRQGLWAGAGDRE